MENMRIERFEDIEAWQLARKLTHKVYYLVAYKQSQSKKRIPEPLNPER